MVKSAVSKATLGRLPLYLQYLKTHSQKSECTSASTIARELQLGEVQVRKDLNAVSGAGRPKIGYCTNELIASIENTLGYNNTARAVLVGAGKLGCALLQYDGFAEYGIQIAAAFDIRASHDEGTEILPMSQFDGFCKENAVTIGIITVQAGSAQQICDRMLQNGIRAIWNFTPDKLVLPQDALLKQENLALSLAHLNSQLCNRRIKHG